MRDESPLHPERPHAGPYDGSMMSLPEDRPPLRTVMLSALACGLALSVPSLVVDFPVTTDLPQHLGQVRLFIEALRNPDGPYVIQWATPYLLGYLLPALAWLVSSPGFAGPLTLVLCALAWSASVHALAWRTNRGLAPAILACTPFFGVSLQWGFLSFMVGFALFVLFFIVLSHALDEPERLSVWLWFGAAALGVYVTHLLWFGAAMVVAAMIATRRRAWKYAGRALLALLPSIALAAWSTLRVHQGFNNSTVWGNGLTTRLLPSVWGAAAFGPAKDLVPTVLFLTVLGLAVAGLWQRRHTLEPRTLDLLWVAALFIVFTLAFPARYTNTIQFETRWASPAMAFLVLGAPLPRLQKGLDLLVAGLLVALTVGEVSLVWWHVNDEELSGLQSSLEALPDGQRTLGLSYLKESAHVRGSPFIQMFAWAQVRHGGELNFSFADFAVMPVVFRVPRRSGWTIGLEWMPERVKREDFKAFDYVILSGPEEIHDEVERTARYLSPVTHDGLWRLYKVMER